MSNRTSRWVEEDDGSPPSVPCRRENEAKASDDFVEADDLSEIAQEGIPQDGKSSMEMYSRANQTVTPSAPDVSSFDEKKEILVPDSGSAATLTPTVNTMQSTIDSLQSIESTTIVPIPGELRREAPFQIDHPPGAYAMSGPNFRLPVLDRSEMSSGINPSSGQHLQNNQSQATGQSELTITADATIVATVVDQRKVIPCGTLVRDRRVVCILFLNVLVISGLLTGLVLNRNGTRGANTPLSYFHATMAPSKPPVRQTNSPTKISQTVIETISKAAPDGGLNLMNDTTPQYAAFHWLLNDPRLPNYTSAKLLQRYALGTFAFSVQPSSDDYVTENPIFGTNENTYGDECNWTTAIRCNAAGHVSILDLAHTFVKAYFPSELALLDQLESLVLYTNNLYGTIPSAFERLQRLTRVALGWNALTGTLPTELGLMSRLQIFDVEGNQLTGTIPTEYGAMLALQRLVLNGNFLVGTLPTEILHFRKLTDLEVRATLINGTLPTEIGQLKQLSELDLAQNNLTGSIPSEIRSMDSLQVLKLHDNRLIGKIPALPPSIGSIQLYRNKLTGPIPDLLTLTSLSDIQLSNNRLSGIIPTQLGLLDLVNLRLSDINLSGTIPTELGRFRQLTGDFQLQGNDLTGTIPTHLGFLSNLASSFDLSFNTLSGTIPSELGNLVHVQHMYLHKNPSLGGTLPIDFGRLIALVDLFAYETSLNGTVPASLCNLTKVNLTGIYLNCDVDCACCRNRCY